MLPLGVVSFFLLILLYAPLTVYFQIPRQILLFILLLMPAFMLLIHLVDLSARGFLLNFSKLFPLSLNDANTESCLWGFVFVFKVH